MLVHDARDSVDLRPSETTATLQPDRIEPEFCDIIVAFHMDVRRLIAIARIEKEPVRANAQDSGHRRGPRSVRRVVAVVSRAHWADNGSGRVGLTPALPIRNEPFGYSLLPMQQAVKTESAPHRLTIGELLDWMVEDKLVTSEAAEDLKKERRYYRGALHPLVIIAEQKWRRPGARGKLPALEPLPPWLPKPPRLGIFAYSSTQADLSRRDHAIA